MIKSLLLAVPALFALSFTSNRGTTSQTGTVVANQRQGSEALISLRQSSGKLTLLTLGKSAHLTTADGHAIRPGDIRVGDHLTLRGGQIQDTSQRAQSMRGVISVAPLDVDDPIVLQITPSLMIAVDTGSGIRYSDRSRETSSVAQLQDADILQIQGIFDSAMGEMTHTTAIARLGPSHQKKHTTRKK